MENKKDWVGRIGFRYREEIHRLDPKMYETIGQYSTCNLADGSSRAYVMDRGIKPLGKSRKIVGPAITVELPPGDNLMLHKAMGLAKPGDILVVRTWGSQDFSVCGGLMMRRMCGLGIQGVIVDGCVRDGEDFAGLEFPVFARGINPVGCRKEGPGQINFPMVCGGVVVMPGDTVAADEDGILVLPEDDVAEVVNGAAAKVAKEKKAMEEIHAGILVKPNIERILQDKLKR